ncbi:PREDICTED: WUSCHEL-related homeobox 9-like [Ipomoea nil]|uniref:WUSCHEL-related homeobox 9-like n=1 Tax=Ipomoea nil TaxID=35883 RepID=UPI00090138E7|nr:PREDICTED: WUSCHEL-related homeobox 9-like [Ipomoea nil]
MSSSKRHWLSMFKSKPCNTLHPWHRHRHILNSSLKPPSTAPSGGASEERSATEPKARWNPKMEQVHILEAIFNSGMVNPPKEEIRNSKTKLQDYGQVRDANVFYWFQNRKSRTKHKLRYVQTSTKSLPPVWLVSSLHGSTTIIAGFGFDQLREIDTQIHQHHEEESN